MSRTALAEAERTSRRPGSRRAASADTAQPRADAIVCRLLCVRTGGPQAGERAAQRLFGSSMLLSAARCLLSYVVFPILTPVLGIAAGVGPAIGIPIGVLALVFDVRGVRRFWLARHRLRWPITFIYLAVIGLVMTLVAGDITTLAG